MTKFTPEGIAATRAILARATSGPVQVKHDYSLDGATTVVGNVDGEYVDGRLDVGFDFVCSTLDDGGFNSDEAAKAVANAAAIVAALNILPAALDEIEQERAALSAMVQQNGDLRAELSRVKAERNESVVLLDWHRFWLNGALTCEAWAWEGDQRFAAECNLADTRSFLSRMEGRKDG